MNTDEDRRLARAAADARQAQHTERADPDHQIALNKAGADVHYVGLLGEFAAVHELGGAVDITFRPGGDDGVDLTVVINGHRYKVDVKTSTYLGPDQYLRVPVDHWDKDTIYIAAIYADDEVNLVRWAWGEDIKRLGTVRTFPPQSQRNYCLPLAKCRKLSVLQTIVEKLG